MDNIFIFTPTLLENITNTKRVLKCLQEHDLFLKPEKCNFWQTKVEYLGHIIKEGKISMDPVKIKGLIKWPAPKTLK